jgi:hypothetical protein
MLRGVHEYLFSGSASCQAVQLELRRTEAKRLDISLADWHARDLLAVLIGHQDRIAIIDAIFG